MNDDEANSSNREFVFDSESLYAGEFVKQSRGECMA